jgi:DNA-binding CsgD family transcriptional regulator
VEKLGPHKVRFILPEPRGNFLEQLAFLPVGSPKHYLQQFHPAYGDPERLERLRQQYNVANKKSVYSLMKSNQNPELPRLDPWILRRANQLSPISYIRNPYYFAVDTSGNQLPYIDRIQLEGVDQLMMPMSVSSGRATMQFRYIRFENFAEYIALAEQNNYSVRGWLAGSRSAWLISPNLNRLVTAADKTSETKSKLLSDKEFRQALSLAIDRQTIVQAVYSGQSVFGGEIVNKLPSIQTADTRAEKFAEKSITEKEFEIVELVANGLSNKEIAEQLFLSEGTVRNYLSNILDKLDLRDRTQLVVYYYQS